MFAVAEPSFPVSYPRLSEIPPTTFPIAHGCLLGGAVGDALGAAVEELTLAEIRDRYGRDGYRGKVAEYSNQPTEFTGRTSEESQLALLMVEAMIRSSVRARDRGTGAPTVGMLQAMCVEWLRTQLDSVPAEQYPLRSGLLELPAVAERRGASRTVLTALLRAAERQQSRSPLGTTSTPINDSKGSAGAVRVAACGFLPHPARSFDLACEAAALTHGHPSGWLAAGTFAAIISGLWTGNDLPSAVDLARTELGRHNHHREVSTALAAAVRSAASGPPSPEQIESLGAGWTAPEALAMAVYAALTAESVGGTPQQIVERGLRAAVNHSGDSDATGAMCGNLLGARYGYQAIPEDWAGACEIAGPVWALAQDFTMEFGPRPPVGPDYYIDPHWAARFHG
ncbi:ADP-ribosylglycohydrolase family protein [Nocardia cyriacigeorgica]|nr:ADP-ribosylglycohydrolase family protein [Nocardia cyriacigeorgica]MBF6436639.1 ADP-ribosylglycohydrolase family protein [Nocardia cyriacigeorgica]MBF6452208.1 ADP-ribosylglycohydrolase family protein [Nocardia cyriacigeorgica]MBF6477741.1 ADP-ribosylglycohydrolase family protein [Nocardia cyriacigeorgica]MBF6549377.1 ADP-ribosylglycohydrolase family protein [Nocardia cyriacigeorgica]